MMVSRLVILATVLTVVLTSPHGARAGFWISITVDPEQPSANERVRVSVQTLQTSSNCLTDPNVETTPFVAYDGINSVTLVDAFELRALAPDPVRSFGGGDPACIGFEETVTVLPESDVGTPAVGTSLPATPEI